MRDEVISYFILHPFLNWVNGMQSIKDVIQDIMSESGFERKMEECRILPLWYDVASSMSGKTEPVEIFNGRMLVNVADSVLMHVLMLYKRKYIDKINLISGKPVLKDIVFRIGKVESKKQASESRDDYARRLHSIQLTNDEQRRIDEIVSEIDDEDIRGGLRDLFMNQNKLTKMRGGG